jgi:UDPglucose--hexose-1-phosphate uridylyltransferase
MSQFQLPDHSHRRLNPLTGEWLLVSPHRAKRPWLGQVERVPQEQRPAYDPQCYLCPGNARATGGASNPAYPATYVFPNDFAALLPDSPSGACNIADLLVARAERGLCRVICFSPRHDLSLAEMTAEEILPVVETWVEQTVDLAANPEINYVQLFENKGAVMGCSNPHPHGQVWASESIPGEPAKELAQQRAYLHEKGSCLLCDYLEIELRAGERIVCANEHFVALVPFWACWPFEVMVLPRRHAGMLPELAADERRGLADIMQRVTARYDNLFEVAFPYSMGWHQAPTDGEAHDEWHLHAHFFPPLLRSATVKKFMVGFEMLANPQRDITPETAAERLRALSEVHYKVAQPSRP